MNLPIDRYKDQIISSVYANDVTVISAETGAGKSLHVPMFLEQEGFNVCVTEPRRIAASSLARVAAEERGETLGEKIGFATAFEQNRSENTDILYVTDGLQLVTEINSKPSSKKRVLVIDEVHEWNLNVETLLAWAKFQLENGWNTKLVIMSATLESSLFESYFCHSSVGVINAEGRSFNVEMFERTEEDIEEVIIECVSRNENVLVFLPGKPEIEALISSLSQSGISKSACILPLHGDLSYEEQRLCFKSYFPKVKIICATNIAQTSITVSDIDTVIDTGLEKRIESDNGIESLTVNFASRADLLQRKGRAGRTKDGKYYLCSYVGFYERSEYQTPEILRLNLETVILRLANASIDAGALKFVHQPSESSILIAHRLLKELSAIDDEGKLTSIGKKMSNLPLNARYSRMVVEAKKRRCLEGILPIVAVLQNGTLLNYKNGGKYCNFSSETGCDLLSELDVFNAICGQGYINFKENGINGKVYGKVKEYVTKLKEVLRSELEEGSSEKLDRFKEREALECCIITGMPDLLFQKKYFYGKYLFGNADFRGYLSKGSTVDPYFADLVLGIPSTITSSSGVTTNIINFVTKTSVEQMLELVPGVIEKAKVPDDDSDKYWLQGTRVMEKHRVLYKGQELEIVYEEVKDEAIISAVLERENRIAEERQRKRQEMIANRHKPFPDVLVVNGISYNVFNASYDPYIVMGVDRLFELECKQLKMESGQTVCVECEGRKSSDIDTLKTHIEDKFLMDEIKNLKLEILEGCGYINLEDSGKVLGLLPKIGEYDITCERCGITFRKTVFLALVLKEGRVTLSTYSDYDSFFTKTMEVLRSVFANVTSKKFPSSRFYFSIKGKKTLTNKGSRAKAYFEKERQDALKSLSIDNFDYSLEYLAIVYEEALGMLEST